MSSSDVHVVSEIDLIPGLAHQTPRVSRLLSHNDIEISWLDAGRRGNTAVQFPNQFFKRFL